MISIKCKNITLLCTTFLCLYVMSMYVCFFLNNYVYVVFPDLFAAPPTAITEILGSSRFRLQLEFDHRSIPVRNCQGAKRVRDPLSFMNAYVVM